MRKIAVWGMAWLAVMICISMFFAGTIKTMTTAKVQLVAAKEGRIEERIRLEGKLIFPETSEVTVSGLGDDIALSTKVVYVGEGRWVEAGEPLFSADVVGYPKLQDGYQEEYNAAQSDSFEIDRKLGSMRMTRMEEMWLEAHDALVAADQEVLKAQTDLQVYDNLHANGEERQVLENAVTDAWSKKRAAQDAFDKINRMGINQELMQLVLDSREAQQRRLEAGAKITALRTLKEQAACICAPHAGYVVSIPIKVGATYNGQGPAMVMSAESLDQAGGVLRADLSKTDKRIEIGTKITITAGGAEIGAEVTDRGIDANGSWYADVAVTREQITELGGAAHLMSENTSMICTYRAKTSTTLLPVSAVRGTGDNRYVLLVSEKRNSLGEAVMVAVKQEVHVITETEDTVSIEENLGRQRVAYMEDRPIDDGTEVMAYAQ